MSQFMWGSVALAGDTNHFTSWLTVTAARAVVIIAMSPHPARRKTVVAEPVRKGVREMIPGHWLCWCRRKTVLSRQTPTGKCWRASFSWEGAWKIGTYVVLYWLMASRGHQIIFTMETTSVSVELADGLVTLSYQVWTAKGDLAHTLNMTDSI